MIPIEYLKECFKHDHKTGFLYWRVRPYKHFQTKSGFKMFNTRFSNKKAGSKMSAGYILLQFTFKNKKHKQCAHTIIWALCKGFYPKNEIDHINGVRTDNRIKNLRDVTRSENTKNRRLSKNNKSGFMGVSWHKNLNMWRARISVNNKDVSLGLYKNKEDAVKARKQAEMRYGYHRNHGRS